MIKKDGVWVIKKENMWTYECDECHATTLKLWTNNDGCYPPLRCLVHFGKERIEQVLNGKKLDAMYWEPAVLYTGTGGWQFTPYYPSKQAWDALPTGCEEQKACSTDRKRPFQLSEKKEMSTASSEAKKEYTSTVAADTFVNKPLANAAKEIKDGLGLPGLGEKAKEKLQKEGIQTPADVFFKYMLMQRDGPAFIAYLEEHGVIFVGGGIAKRTVEEVKALLIKTLDDKWDIVKQY